MYDTYNVNTDEIEETNLWALYNKGVNFNRQRNLFSETDDAYRMYNGDQWKGLKVGDISRVQLNYIKPVVKYKISTLNSNLFAINFSSFNYDNLEERKVEEGYCKALNKKMSTIFERVNLDTKIRRLTKDSAITGEAIMYVSYNEDEEIDIELINNTDIFYGDENETDIQTQPYIVVSTRTTVEKVREIAKNNGVSEDDIKLILGDSDTELNIGEDKEEVNENCTVITKFYKKDGKVHYARSTKLVDIIEDENSGLEYYPFTKLIWEDVKGSSRGVGEVKYLIPNQIELNKILMRRAVVSKNTSYPTKIANLDMISNPQDVDKIGATIKVRGLAVQNVKNAFDYTTTSNIASDAEKLQMDLLQTTRELAGAGDIATGDVNPETASGKAILAVQQASQAPMVEQKYELYKTLEELARIIVDILVVQENGIKIYDEVTGEYMQVTKSQMKKNKFNIKIDVTPKSTYDKYAQELSLENLYTSGAITFAEYVKSLDDDSVMPKKKLEKILKDREEAQKRISEMEIMGQQLQNEANNVMLQMEQEDIMKASSTPETLYTGE